MPKKEFARSSSAAKPVSRESETGVNLQFNRLLVTMMFAAFAFIPIVGVSRPCFGENAAADPAREQFAQNLIAALESKNPARVKKLIHPQVLACTNFAEYFDLMKWQEFQSLPGPGYKVSFTALAGDFKAPFLPPDKFAFPVQPTYQLQIDWQRGPNSLASLVHFIAEKDGAWWLVYPCPNDAGIQLARQMVGASHEKK
jgi:hypothetical protein